MSLVHWSQTHGQQVKSSDSDCHTLEQPLSPPKKWSHPCFSRIGTTPDDPATPTGGNPQ